MRLYATATSLLALSVLLLPASAHDPSLTPFKRHQAVLGTVPEVSRKIEDGLSDASIAIISKQLSDGERRLAGQDRQSGRVFCIHLYGKKAGKIDKTLVSIEMDSGANEAFWQKILGFATAPRAAADSSADGGNHPDGTPLLGAQLGALLGAAGGGAIGSEVDASRRRAVQVAAKQRPVAELVAILDKTESKDTFLLTVMVLRKMGPQAKEALPAVIRNAERLGLVNGIAKALSKAKGGTRGEPAVSDAIDEICEAILEIASGSRSGKQGQPVATMTRAPSACCAPIGMSRADAPPPAHGSIKTVKVSITQTPAMRRLSSVAGLQEQLTKEIVGRIQEVTPWKVVQSDADSELVVTIHSFTLANTVYSPLNELQECEATLVVELCWRDLRTGEVLSRSFPPRSTSARSPDGATSQSQGKIGATRTDSSAPGEGTVPGGLPGVLVRSVGSFRPELGESPASAQQRSVRNMATRIIALMEKGG